MPNVPRKYVVEAACQEVKVEIEPGDRTARASYARWLAAYVLREQAGASLGDIRDALSLASHASVHRGLAACREAIEKGDNGIHIGGQYFAGSIVDAANRIWAKATIRAATERTAA